mgnify:CR=1 FL=1
MRSPRSPRRRPALQPSGFDRAAQSTELFSGSSESPRIPRQSSASFHLPSHFCLISPHSLSTSPTAPFARRSSKLPSDGRTRQQMHYRCFRMCRILHNVPVTQPAHCVHFFHEGPGQFGLAPLLIVLTTTFPPVPSSLQTEVPLHAPLSNTVLPENDSIQMRDWPFG